MHSPFAQAFIYLLASVITVPVAKRLGLGSVLGYLIAGVAIGPYVLRLVSAEGGGVMHFAEFGVVMMLFLVGLELKPALLWQMRGPIFGLGGSQVVVTALVICATGLAFLPWRSTLALGFIFAMSSTAIALQTLEERALLKTPGGEASFAVLLFQDISVIPILALLPLLAVAGRATGTEEGALDGLPGWEKALLVLGAVATVILAGRFLLRPLFRYIAETRLREMFTASALLLVIGIALLMTLVGLSAALGTFLAGVVLAESEYRHQLEADVEPFKGLLLGLFFISVGASIDFGLIGRSPLLVAELVLALIVLKAVVLFGLGKGFGLEGGQALLLAAAVAQGGEFAFVLFSFATQQGVLPAELANLMVAVVAMSMAVAPLLFTLWEKWVLPRVGKRMDARAPDIIDENENPVILAGFGRFGHIVGRLLRANGLGTTVLDHDPDQVETLRRFGLKCFYGDASRLDLLHAAGAAKAKLFVLATDNDEKSLEIIDTVRQHFPHLRIFARASSRQHAYEILRRGLNDVYRETLGSALDLGTDALLALGVPRHQARRSVKIFRAFDEDSLRQMANISADDPEYTSRARQHVENLERVLKADQESRAVRARTSRHTVSAKGES